MKIQKTYNLYFFLKHLTLVELPYEIKAAIIELFLAFLKYLVILLVRKSIKVKVRAH